MPTDHRYRGHADSKLDPESNNVIQDIQRTAEELEFNFSTLLNLSSNSQILFRITDPTSISPLYWTGNPSTSGFGCPNLYLASLDQQTYHKVFHHLSPTSQVDTPFASASRSDSGWEEEPYIRHSVLDHVQGREKQTCLNTLTSIDERPGTPEDESSPWISTSNNLIWVIYDIVRRLVFLKRDIVYLTIISHPHSSRTSTSRQHDPSPSHLLHKQDSETGDEQGGAGYRGSKERQGREGRTGRGKGGRGRGKEILINPIPILRITHPRAKELMLSVSMKENYELARRASEWSGEMLIWGRVFGDSIIGHLEFTRDHTPLDIPLQFFKPTLTPTNDDKTTQAKKRSKKGGRWTDRLIWDPKVDDYQTVRQIVQDRYWEISATEAKTKTKPKPKPKPEGSTTTTTTKAKARGHPQL